MSKTQKITEVSVGWDNGLHFCKVMRWSDKAGAWTVVAEHWFTWRAQAEAKAAEYRSQLC